MLLLARRTMSLLGWRVQPLWPRATMAKSQSAAVADATSGVSADSTEPRGGRGAVVGKPLPPSVPCWASPGPTPQTSLERATEAAADASELRVAVVATAPVSPGAGAALEFAAASA
ncbi:unnamed protein product [Prorocentrum cordatum]|uniref:Uncharacterized protein n=1 Tax=Prorocentrum cordatum TaxID=2364126 RepID=A0ABN9PCL7_9DINO|nr:unnamed protein product [Polarella glacialis]